MGDGALTAVADAGPWIHLHEVGCLPLLSQFQVLHVPDAVWAEITTPGRLTSADIHGVGNAQRHSPPTAEVVRFTSEHSLTDLQSGERESLWLARKLGVGILLTDDLAAREAARSLHLRPVGSLGIIAHACVQKIVSLEQAEQSMTDLYVISSLFVTPTIVEMAIDDLRQRVT